MLQRLSEVSQWQQCLQLTVLKPFAMCVLGGGGPPGGDGRGQLFQCHAQTCSDELEHLWNVVVCVFLFVCFLRREHLPEKLECLINFLRESFSSRS